MLKQTHIPRQIIEIDGHPTTHAITGGGDAVLLLHGWGVEISMVWPLAAKLAALGYRVYALDLPGFGDTPPPPVVWTVFDYAAFVRRYMDAVGLERAHLFGHSFGGRLGLILGAEHPERLNKMALAGSAGLRSAPPWTARARLRMYKLFRSGLQSVRLSKLAENLQKCYNEKYGSADFKAAEGVMRQTFVNVVNQDLRDYARRVAVPTLLIWGADDADTPLQHGEMLERLIPDAGLVVYPSAGHYAYLEHVQQTAQAIHALFGSSES
ncbi:MAG: alpha/beta hydrolase [Anaerolineaceae bacterium]|nr:MAG: alpha/beta hydrolase [Anaerolineaceae bacterium]